MKQSPQSDQIRSSNVRNAAATVTQAWLIMNAPWPLGTARCLEPSRGCRVPAPPFTEGRCMAHRYHTPPHSSKTSHTAEHTAARHCTRLSTKVVTNEPRAPPHGCQVPWHGLHALLKGNIATAARLVEALQPRRKKRFYMAHLEWGKPSRPMDQGGLAQTGFSGRKIKK